MIASASPPITPPPITLRTPSTDCSETSSPAATPMPGPVPTSPAPVGNHGLPRRRPGDLLLSGGGDANFGGPDDPNLPPDPDTVRARLSGLASGLVAGAVKG